MKIYSLVYVSVLSIRPDSSDLNTDVVMNMAAIIRCENLPNSVKVTFLDFYDRYITYVLRVRSGYIYIYIGKGFA
jgi:hypothetical protein